MPQSKPRSGKPDAAAFGQMNAYIRQHKPTYMDQGSWNQVVTAKIQEFKDADLNNDEIHKALADWYGEFPKAP